jgi:hypothetical protein
MLRVRPATLFALTARMPKTIRLSECRPLHAAPTVYSNQSEAKKMEVYTDYTVYKGKGAMSVKIIKPRWERVPSGSVGLRIARDGTVLLEFAQSRGERQYDWDNKGTIALSAVECGDLLVAVETGIEKTFFHDPNKMASGEGMVTKSFRAVPAREQGYFFSLSINNKMTGQAKYDTALTPGELRVVRRLMDVRDFCLLYILVYF